METTIKWNKKNSSTINLTIVFIPDTINLIKHLTDNYYKWELWEKTCSRGRDPQQRLCPRPAAMHWRPLVRWGRWWVSGSWVSPRVYPALPPAGTECTVSSCAVVASYDKFQWKIPETLNLAPIKYQLAPRFKIVKHVKSVSLKNM